jgi:cytochrome c
VGAAGGTVEFRIDSPDGTLVGTPQTIEVKNGTQSFTIPVAGASGTHKLYLVFRNEKAAANQTIAQVYSIDVQPAKQ